MARLYGLFQTDNQDEVAYQEALEQAAEYGKKLSLSEITLVFFIESIFSTFGFCYSCALSHSKKS